MFVEMGCHSDIGKFRFVVAQSRFVLPGMLARNNVADPEASLEMPQQLGCSMTVRPATLLVAQPYGLVTIN